MRALRTLKALQAEARGAVGAKAPARAPAPARRAAAAGPATRAPAPDRRSARQASPNEPESRAHD